MNVKSLVSICEIRGGIAADAPESFGLSPMQMEKLDCRVAEHNADPTTAIPWEQVSAKLFAALE